jgi:Flp pilus assembly protein CpaB
MDPRRRARLLLIIGILLALGAGVGTFFYAQGSQAAAPPPPVPTVDILVAARAIPPKTALQPADVKIAKINADVAPPEAQTFTAAYVKDPKEAIGKVVLQGLSIGEPIFPSKFAPPERAFTVFPPGETVAPGSPHYRIVQLNVADANASGGIIQAGDHVDLMVVFPFDANAKLLLSPPPGLPTPSPTPVPTPVPAGQTPGPSASIPPGQRIVADTIAKIILGPMEVLARSGSVYTFRVDAAMVERFAYMQSAGIQIQLLVRAPGDDRVPQTTGAYFGTVYQQFKFPIPERVSP